MTTDAALFEALKYRVTVDRLGTRRYYNSEGKLHREDGPAVEYPSGTVMWCQNGVLHRTDGPAVEYADGNKEWWINGVEYTEAEYQAQLKALEHTV